MKIKIKNYTWDLKIFIKNMIVLAMIVYIAIDLVASFKNIRIKNDVIEYTPKKIEYEDYVVQKGDTLWSIAEEFYPEKDNRDIVYMIKSDNMCNSNLEIGQVLKIKKCLTK